MSKSNLDPHNLSDETVAAAMRILDDIVIEGTPVDDCERRENRYIRFKAPWYIVDRGTAEPEVNYPGELLNCCEEVEDARKERAREIVRQILLLDK